MAAAVLFVLWRRRHRRAGAASRQMADAEACREDSGRSSGGTSGSAGVKTPLVVANGHHSRQVSTAAHSTLHTAYRYCCRDRKQGLGALMSSNVYCTEAER